MISHIRIVLYRGDVYKLVNLCQISLSLLQLGVPFQLRTHRRISIQYQSRNWNTQLHFYLLNNNNNI